MKIYLASDHAGFELKNAVREHLFHHGFAVADLGPQVPDEDDDYPKYAYQVTTKLLGGEAADRGILICGSGQGMAIAANRVRGIRAAVVWDEQEAKASRNDDDSNVLSLAARDLSVEAALKLVDVWLKTKFSGAERHKRRLGEIEQLYG